jgi:hypothetical protein
MVNGLHDARDMSSKRNTDEFEFIADTVFEEWPDQLCCAA